LRRQLVLVLTSPPRIIHHVLWPLDRHALSPKPAIRDLGTLGECAGDVLHFGAAAGGVSAASPQMGHLTQAPAVGLAGVVDGGEGAIIRGQRWGSGWESARFASEKRCSTPY